MGKRFLLPTHTGHKSGLKHQTVIEVVSHNEMAGAYYAAVWREKSDRYRNIQQNPTIGLQVRDHKFQTSTEQISTQETEERLRGYAQKYPTAFDELVTTMLGEGLPPDKETCCKVAKCVPLISLAPIG
jgi:deazaflavin-dependent oxidoreductase (nitroreductase family)